MSKDGLQKFEKLLESNPKLLTQLRSAKSEDAAIKEALHIGKENKIDLTADDLKQRLKELKSQHGALNMKELDSVAGGSGQGASGWFCGC